MHHHVILTYHVVHMTVRQEEVFRQTTAILVTCSIGEVVTANSWKTGEYSRETTHCIALFSLSGHLEKENAFLYFLNSQLLGLKIRLIDSIECFVDLASFRLSYSLTQSKVTCIVTLPLLT